MRPIHYEITVIGSPELVWQVLTDLPSYPSWNQYSTSAQGDLRVGGNVGIVAHVGQSTQHVNNRVLEVQPPKRLCWESRNWYYALVYGVRCRTITAQPDGKSTVFREEEIFHGPLGFIVARVLERQLLDGLRVECECLKAEVERRAAAQANT